MTASDHEPFNAASRDLGEDDVNRLARLRTLSIYLWTAGILLLFWWPLSHWFYADGYHRLLGFQNPEQYVTNPLIKMIGTLAFFPVLLMFFAALDPLRNRDIVKALIVSGLLAGATFFYLIQTHGIPQTEYANAILCVSAPVVLLALYPWKMNARGKQAPPQSETNNALQ